MVCLEADSCSETNITNLWLKKFVIFISNQNLNMRRKKEISTAESDWVIEDDELIDDDEDVVDKREFLDADGNDIFKKKSADKTVEERIQTSRSLKIKHNKWNQVDIDEDYNENDKITIDPHFTLYNSTVEDVEFENKFHNILLSSKYSTVLFPEDGEKSVINYQIVNDILLYVYARMKEDYSLVQIFVLLCEYCGITISTMWRRTNSYYQMKMLEELKESSKLPKEILDNDIQFF